MEQILDNTSPDLQLWLREHEPKTVDKLTTLADVYRTSRQSYNRHGQGDNRAKKLYRQNTPENQNVSNSLNQTTPSVQSDVKSSTDRMKYITCYKCNQKGHYQVCN